MNQNNRQGEFIDIYRLEDIDESVFKNYQRYDFFQLIWFTEVAGDKTYYLDFNEYTLQDNQLALIFPGQIDKLSLEGKRGYLFAIHADTFFNMNLRMKSDYLNGYHSSPFVSPDPDTTETLYTLLNLLEQEYRSHKRLTLMEVYLEAFLFHVASLAEDSGQTGKRDSFVVELMRLIDKNFIAQRETDFYARQLNVTCKKLNGISLRGTGKTVKQHLLERLVLEIKKEIRLGEKSLKEIAFDLDFSEPAYFTRFFKKYTGKTPTEFRDETSSGA